MKTKLSRKNLSLAVAAALVLGFTAGAAQAQRIGPASEREIWMENTRGQVWKNGYGECWHSAFGPPPGYNECNPAPVAQYVPPAPAAYVPPAPVIIAAAPPQPVYEKYSLDANVLFDFDKSVLRPAGRDTLDQFVSRLKDVDSSATITAVGFADRFGTDGYNQALSERRVETVKNYLVAKGIEPKWVSSSGAGELRPTTRAGECNGAANARTIACLQPDRHVFIEVTGSRLKK